MKTVNGDLLRLAIVNAYTQFHYRGKKPLVDYDALASAFRMIADDFDGKRIGYPKIGTGLAGGLYAAQ
jgi:O-acetyl-ADP-ribose deacetylase (regulator of RNase III)